MNKEVGSVICRGSKAIGVSHSHPLGSIKLSSQDRKTAHSKGLRYVCIATRGHTKCYRFHPKQQ